MTAAALALLLSACGLGGSAGGGADNLPTSGAGPYGKIEDPTLSTPLDEPYVVESLAIDLSEPTAIALPDGGFRLWFSHAPRNGASEIWTADLPALDQKASEPVLALAADQGWEDGNLRAPAIVQLGDDLIMFYQGGGAVGRATWNGVDNWRKDGLVLADAAAPSALEAAGTWYLYYTRPEDQSIHLARSTDGMTFVPDAEPVLEPRMTQVGTFDRVGVGEPAAVGGITPAGQLHIGLFYTGAGADGNLSIGYAGSGDGATFERFNKGLPILQAGVPAERGPAPVLFASRGVLFFSQKSAQTWAIAAATTQ